MFAAAGKLKDVGVGVQNVKNASVATNVLTAVKANVAGQAASMALGLQRKFSLAGVGSAGLTAGTNGLLVNQMGLDQESPRSPDKPKAQSGINLKRININSRRTRMVNYRRNQAEGNYFFFTVNLMNRNNNYLTSHIEALRESFRMTNKKYPYKTIAMVVLPEHIHAIWELPEKDRNYSHRWRYIKKQFTTSLMSGGVKIIINHRGEADVWQRRFWEHTIRDEKELEKYINYIHYNPIKHGYVNHLNNWPYSTFHRYVKDGLLNIDWACNDELKLEVGE